MKCDQGSPRMKKRWGEVAKEDLRRRWLKAVESNQSLLVHLWCWQFELFIVWFVGNRKPFTLLVKNLKETELSTFCKSGSLHIALTF